MLSFIDSDHLVHGQYIGLENLLMHAPMGLDSTAVFKQLGTELLHATESEDFATICSNI